MPSYNSYALTVVFTHFISSNKLRSFFLSKLSFILSVSASQVNAEIGDIKLTQAPGHNDGTSIVSIYYSDGHDPAAWGEICPDSTPGTTLATISKTVCQQYGRTDGEFVSLRR